MDNNKLRCKPVCSFKLFTFGFIGFLLAQCFVSVVFATEIRLVLTHIPRVMEYGKPDAPYNRLIRELDRTLPIDFSVEFMPSSRANKLLNAKQIDCLFPIIPLDDRATKTVLSAPVNGISAYLFSTHTEIYTDLSQLKGKMVVYLRGYLFGGLINEHPEIRFFAVSSQKAALGMLEKNRAVAYLDYIPDIRYVFTKRQMAKLKYDASSPIIRDFDRFECLDSPKSNEFLLRLNTSIKHLRETGELEKILGSYYVNVELN